jgi:hypothetical protein
MLTWGRVQEKEAQQSLELQQMNALTEMRTEVEAYQRKEKERRDMLERLAKAKAQQEKRQVRSACLSRVVREREREIDRQREGEREGGREGGRERERAGEVTGTRSLRALCWRPVRVYI